MKLRVLIFGYIFLNASASAANLGLAPLYLEIGEQRLISFPQIDQFSISGDSIHYKRLGNDLLLKAVHAGVSEIVVRSGSNESFRRSIHVSEKMFYQPSLLQKALGTLNEVEVISTGSGWLLRGQVRSLHEAIVIAALREQNPKDIVDQTTLSSEFLEKAAPEIQDIIKPYDHVKMTTENGMIRVSGSFPSRPIAHQVQKNVQRICPLVQWDASTLQGQNPAVYFKIFLLHIRKEDSNLIGMGWPSQIPTTFAVSPIRWTGPDSIDISLQALETVGKVKILSAPELVVRSPGSAELFSGGEFPIQTYNRWESSVTWKNFGLSLKLNLEEVSDPEVRLSIESEISQIDQSLADQNAVPGLRSNRIKTQVDATFSMPLLLSGLLQDTDKSSSQGISFLSKIPFIGALFGTQGEDDERIELVAVLIPYRNPPSEVLGRVEVDAPKGYWPLPRNWLSQEDIAELKDSKKWPWNAL